MATQQRRQKNTGGPNGTELKPFPNSKRRPNLIKLNPKKDQHLVAKVNRMQRLMSNEAKRLIREANAIGLKYIQHQALEHLRQDMSDARRPFRTGRLEAAIVDDKYSKADGLGIRFLIDKLIREDVPYYAALEYGDRHSIGRQIPFIFLGTKRGKAPGNSPDAKKSAYKNLKAPNFARSNGIKVPGQRREIRRLGGDEHGYRGKGVYHNERTDRVVGPREIGRLNGKDPNVRARRNKQGKIKGDGVFLVTIKRPVPDYRYGQKARDDFLDNNFYEKTLNDLIRGSLLEKEGIQFILTGR